MDAFKNFAKSTLAAGITSGATSLTVATGDGVKFPAVAFNAAIWNLVDYPDPTDDPNHEIVRVTAVATDTFTITRAQEGTTGVAHNTGGKVYGLVATLTAKTLNEIKDFAPWINVKDFGAKGDGRRVTDGAMTIGFPTLTSATAVFTAADVGKVALVHNAGGGTTSMLNTTIATFVNSTTVTLAANATATVSGVQVRYGSDDTVPLQAAFTAAKTTGGKIKIPRGRYFTTFLDVSRFNLTLKSQLIVEGEGFQESIIQHFGTNVCIYLGGSRYTTWRDLSMDSGHASQVGVLACRLSDAPTCSHHVWENFGSPIGGLWLKAPFVGISIEETTQRSCEYDNEAGVGTGATLYYTNKNTQIAVTLPNSDTINESSAVANRIEDCSIVAIFGGFACVCVEYGAEVEITGRTYLGVLGASTTTIGVRIAGDATIPSYCPVVIGPGCDIEMNGGPCVELRSYSGTNTIAGPVIRASFISQSTQLISYAGTIITNGLIYDGNSELQFTSTLTLTGTHNFPQITISGVNTNVVLSSGATIAGARIFARAFTDSGAVYSGINDLRTLTTSGSTVANMTAQRYQSFTFAIRNNGGVIEHEIMADNASAIGSLFADKINGATAAFVATPSVTPAAGFTNGAGINAAATNQIIFDTAAQIDGQQSWAPPAVEGNNTGTAWPVLNWTQVNINVNGVTRRRLALTATTNSAVAIPFTAASIGAGTLVRFRFSGMLA